MESGRSRVRAAVVGLGLVLLLAASFWMGWFSPKPHIDYNGPVAGWEHWGNDEGGSRYSPLTQVTPENVAALKPAWTYHVGIVNPPEPLSPTLQVTPITAEGRLYVCSGAGRIAAVDPETGKEIWAADPKSDNFSTYLLNCRGVTYGRDTSVKPGAPCAGRILAGTLDARLVAYDSATGRLCQSFGSGGIVDLKPDLGHLGRGDLSVSSPPVVIGNKVIVNGRIVDNVSVDMPAGAIRAFDLHSGKPVWAWNALPPGMTDAQNAPAGEKFVRATPNSWPPM